MSLPFPFDLPSETRDARSGTVLMDSLADTTHAIYVESGRVALGRLQGGQLTHTVGVVQGPMWLNAGAAVLGLRPLADAVADTRVQLRCVPLPAFHASLQALPGPAQAVLRDMAHMYRLQVHTGLSRAVKDAGARCAEWLLAHAHEEGADPNLPPVASPSSPPPAALTVPLTQRKRLIAAQLGITPETFSRVLRQLRERGLISEGGRCIHLLEPEALRALASQ